MSMQILMPSVSSAPWWRKPLVVVYIWALWFIPAFLDATVDDIGESHQAPIQILISIWTTIVIVTALIWYYGWSSQSSWYLWGDLAQHFGLGALYWAHVRYGHYS